MYDVIVIGCGVVGAATAYRLARYRLRTAVLEACNDVANGTTKANSAIIHAGYDPEPGTLMAALNVEYRLCHSFWVCIGKQTQRTLAYCLPIVEAFFDEYF